MAGSIMACRDYNFVGTMYEMGGTVDHYDVIRDGVSQPVTICGEGATKDKAIEEMEKNSKDWCRTTPGYVLRSFKCERFSSTSDVRIIENPGCWDKFVALFHKYIM